MLWTPCLVRSSGSEGEVRASLGDPLVDDYLGFVAARSRPNTVLATAYDLKVFFSVVGKEPVRVSLVSVKDKELLGGLVAGAETAGVPAEITTPLRQIAGSGDQVPADSVKALQDACAK